VSRDTVAWFVDEVLEKVGERERGRFVPVRVLWELFKRVCGGEWSRQEFTEGLKESGFEFGPRICVVEGVRKNVRCCLRVKVKEEYEEEYEEVMNDLRIGGAVRRTKRGKRGRKGVEWTPEMLRKLKMRYHIEGRTVRACAQELRLGYEVVRRKLKELGWLRERKGAMEWDGEELEELRQMYCVKGLSLHACARALGASEWAAKAKLQGMGVTISKNKSERGGEAVVTEVCNDLYDVYEKFLSYSVRDRNKGGGACESFDRFAFRLKRLINDMWGFEFGGRYPKFGKRGR